MRKPIYLHPLTDYGFKRYFKDKEVLIHFLNTLFRGRKRIVDLTYQNTEVVGAAEDMGTVIFDLKAMTDTGEIILIEVQTTGQKNLIKRMLYYGSKTISDQAPKGNRSAWAYDVSEVYVIVLLDGFTLDESDNKDVLHDICLCNRESGEVFYEGFGFIYLELINFTKQEHEVDNDLDWWLYVLNNIAKLDKMPRLLQSEVFVRFFQIGEYSKLNEEERTMYDISLKHRWDRESIRQTQLEYQQKQEDESKALEKAREEVARDRVQADQALAQVDQERAKLKAEKLELAKSMLTLGMDVSSIANRLDLSLKDVQKLQ